LFYQWQFKGATLAGATNATLVLTNVQLNQGGNYAVIVTNLVGSAVSSNALLTVLAPNPPEISLSAPLSGALFSVGSLITITAAVTPGTGAVTNVAFYDGTALLGETNQSPYSLAWTNAPAGTIVLTAVAYANDGLMATSAPVNITVETLATPPTITRQPVSVTTNQGANVTFTVGATGSLPLFYQWQFDGQNLSGATTSTLALTDIQTNQAGNYMVVVTNVAGSTISSNAVLQVIVPPPQPVITLLSPLNQSSFCFGATIPLLAAVSNSASQPTSVAFNAGSSILGSVATAPYSFAWDGAALGNYSLTATASFADGSTLTSSPVLISVGAQCGQVAIVRNAADPEIDLLQSNLFEIGLSSQVFEQTALTFDVLSSYELVIWDNLDGQTNRISGNTVSVLQSVFAAGIPLYLLGQNLASDTLALAEPQRTQWIQLTSLTPATGVGGDGSVELTNQSDQIIEGNYGIVSSFSAASNFDLTTVTNTDAIVLATSGTTVVLAAFPAASDVTSTRIVTQNFEVGGGDDANSLAQRHTLFLNAVCWLVRCRGCTAVGLGLNPTVTPNPATVGQPVTYQWVVENNGECAGTGTVLTTVLPPGAEFVSASSEYGTWQYNASLGTVIFQLGQLPSRALIPVSFTIIPSQPGTFTNTMDVTINGVPPNEGQTIAQVNGLSLTWSGGTNYLLQLTGDAGQSYQIQTSTDLLQWLNWTNVLGPNWEASLPDSTRTNSPWGFYRALDQ
jgi:uncharacterized repeat protein (TIGR01451 family)